MAILTVTEMLMEARAAYHDLQIGKAVASARDSNGEEIRYTQADRTALAGYIASLEAQLNNPTGRSGTIGPMRLRF
ncbi:gpW family head-tail joining protein [Sphingomonas hankookensis]|uniref:gpW family head-tail joining protein n=1 Tax=Sphingomonas hankookensis TaxID=563996 RepID=UPI003D301E04